VLGGEKYQELLKLLNHHNSVGETILLDPANASSLSSGAFFHQDSQPGSNPPVAELSKDVAAVPGMSSPTASCFQSLALLELSFERCLR
jgi:hypothetical protein